MFEVAFIVIAVAVVAQRIEQSIKLTKIRNANRSHL